MKTLIAKVVISLIIVFAILSQSLIYDSGNSVTSFFNLTSEAEEIELYAVNVP